MLPFRAVLLFLLQLNNAAVLVSADPGTLRKPWAATVSFINVSKDSYKIFWQEYNDRDMLRFVTEIPPYEWIHLDSQIGHKFSYQAVVATSSEETTPPAAPLTEVQVLEKDASFAMGPEHYEVQCSTTEGDIHAHIIPNWSPRGATRFIQMVTIGFYDGTALYRVIPNFLTQFGISANPALSNEWKNKQIPDDPPPKDLYFQPGYLSYAGSGKDSRTTQVFVVMPGTSQSQLNYFGSNSWETPFGYIDEYDMENVVANWYSQYGDMSSQGNSGGPDQQRIYMEDGYDYLQKEFPHMSYVHKCEVVSTASLIDEEAEEL